MVSGGARVGDDLKSMLESLAAGEGDKGIELKQPKSEIVVASTQKDPEALFTNNIAAAFADSRPCVFIAQLASGEVAIVHLSPDSAKSIAKMPVALSVSVVHGALAAAGLEVRGEYQATTEEDIDYAEFEAWVSKSGHHARVMSHVEELRAQADEAEAAAAREMEAAAAEALGDSGSASIGSPLMKSPTRGASSGAAVPFQATEKLQDALRSFAGGSLGFVAARVGMKTERLTLVESGESPPSEAELPSLADKAKEEGKPTYYLLRGTPLSAHSSQEEDKEAAGAGEGVEKQDASSSVAMLFVCPDTAKARPRMVSSTAKRPFATAAAAAGIAIAAQYEARDADDVQEAITKAKGGGGAAAGGAGEGAAAAGGESQESMLSSRPKGPGRRRRK